jgi:single-strand DNA-binding protein
MNSANFVGRLVADPALKDVNGTPLVNFTLAVEEYRKDKDGQKKKRVDFLDFEAWDSGASTIAEYCKKGDFLAVETSARQQRWTSGEEKKQKINFRVNNFKMFNNRNDFNDKE